MTDLPIGTVTFLFTDIEGSTGLLQALGDRYPAVLDAHAEIIRRAVADGGGIEVSTHGDAFFVVFRSPAGAVRAALAAQQGLAGHDRCTGRPGSPTPPTAARSCCRTPPGGWSSTPCPRAPPCATWASTACAASRNPSASTSSSPRTWRPTSRLRGRSTPARTTSPCSSPRSWAAKTRSPRSSGCWARPAC